MDRGNWSSPEALSLRRSRWDRQKHGVVGDSSRYTGRPCPVTDGTTSAWQHRCHGRRVMHNGFGALAAA